jgi:hypothetical protein
MIGLFAYPVGALFFPFAWYFNYTSTTSLPKSVCVLLAMQMVCRRMGDFSATSVSPNPPGEPYANCQATRYFRSRCDTKSRVPSPRKLSRIQYSCKSNPKVLHRADDKAVGRAVGPFMVSYFFSISTHAASPYSIGRHIVWVLFVGMCIPSLVLAAKLDKDKPDIKEDSEEEERHELLSH